MASCAGEQHLMILNAVANNSEEIKFVDSINKQLIDAEVKSNSILKKNIINLVMLRKSFLLHKKHGVLRKSEENLKFRLITIKRIIEQIIRDEGVFNKNASNDFLELQVLIATLEAACIVEEKRNKQDSRDMIGLDFHLWALRKILIQQEIIKPVELIALILQKSDFLKDIGISLNANSIKNKLTKIQRLIDSSKKMGACHEPVNISHTHRVSSPAFIKSLSSGCVNCQAIWEELLFAKVSKESAFDIACEQLSKENPILKEIISKVKNELIEEMPIEKILEIIPDKSKAMAEAIFIV